MTASSVVANPALVTRRVVTGHDANGRSIIASDGPSPVNVAIFHPDFVLNEVWLSPSLPADNLAEGEPCSNAELEPGKQGNIMRIFHIPPDAEYMDTLDVAAGFAELGESGMSASTGKGDSPHPLMHRTSTVDYIIVLFGEIHLILDENETLLRPGDVVIQRGTNHAWSNRGKAPCTIAAVLNAAQSIAP